MGAYLGFRPFAMAAVVLLGAGMAQGVRAQQLELFDAHMHYNQEPNPFYSLDKVLEIFKRNNVTGVLATSRPNKGTHQLVDAKTPGLWVVPFIRPYRSPRRHRNVVFRSHHRRSDQGRVQTRLLPRHR